MGFIRTIPTLVFTNRQVFFLHRFIDIFTAMSPAHQILKTYWGFDGFRPIQEEIIRSVLDGKDTLALLPTGGGKSVCFQVPALMQEGICLVVSPLIALIKDQVQNLTNKGIPALSIHSGMPFDEVKKTLQQAVHGRFKFLYVSPERLETRLFGEYLASLQINLIAIDEAHCISQWGYDFRPSYLNIASIREQCPQVPVLALTASATREVQDDICNQLKFKKGQQRFQQSFERPNLSYSVFETTTKQNKLVEILQQVKGTAIVYCKSRRHTKEITEWLQMNQISADYYHAGLLNAVRNAKQEKWIAGETRVMVCTNAFGMGIDKPDVRAVVHFGIPDCLENYYQEAGRAGRDGKKSYAVLLYNQHDLDDLDAQPELRFPPKAELKRIYIALMNHLQVAAGGGEGMSFDFDLAQFCESFKVNVLTAGYAIKTLEQEGLISYNESFFKPSTAVFTSSKEELNSLSQTHPALEGLTQSLLRLYEGIFDFPCTIRENQLARFSGLSADETVHQLKTLQQFGIIEYQQQKEKPQIYLIKSRMYKDSFVLDLEPYHLRKKQLQSRIEKMKSFVQLTGLCRSAFIARYFNDFTVKPCGICDNCLDLKKVSMNQAEFDQVSAAIIQAVQIQPIAVKLLNGHLPEVEKDKVWKVAGYLLDECAIGLNRDGELYLMQG